MFSLRSSAYSAGIFWIYFFPQSFAELRRGSQSTLCSLCVFPLGVLSGKILNHEEH